jgi:hypothetical protein
MQRPLEAATVSRISVTLAAVFAVCYIRQSLAATPDINPSPAPSVRATLVGSPQIVFDTRDGCEKTDIPDTSAHAFRDYQNIVHLVSTHTDARAMTGPSLDKVKEDCHVIYHSPKDTDPAHFQYNNWLTSFYTDDGRHIAALVHSEYDAFDIPGECDGPTERRHSNCWWNTVTFAQSFDGGYSFAVPKPPLNLIASLPYKYEVGNRKGAYGYLQPTNIVKLDGFYYAMINNWPHEAQKYGPCLIRTADVFDPSSWRAWNGNEFAVRFLDPYSDTDPKPEEHVCQPVLRGVAESLVQMERTGVFVVSEITADSRFGAPGLYVFASHDLIHWSGPVLATTISDLTAEDGPGKWSYGYSSILDPTSKDRSFSVVSDSPYIYYVRLDGIHPPYARALVRRRIRVEIGG